MLLPHPRKRDDGLKLRRHVKRDEREGRRKVDLAGGKQRERWMYRDLRTNLLSTANRRASVRYQFSIYLCLPFCSFLQFSVAKMLLLLVECGFVVVFSTLYRETCLSRSTFAFLQKSCYIFSNYWQRIFEFTMFQNKIQAF